MSVGSVGNNVLATAMQQVQPSKQSAAMTQMKGALEQPEQLLELLEQSISVKNASEIANGLGINLDMTI